jgi:hypothetical protein
VDVRLIYKRLVDNLSRHGTNKEPKEPSRHLAVQRWSVTAAVQDPYARLTAGPAEVCATAVTRLGGAATDRRDWCVDVTLIAHTPDR